MQVQSNLVGCEFNVPLCTDRKTAIGDWSLIDELVIGFVVCAKGFANIAHKARVCGIDKTDRGDHVRVFTTPS